MAWHQIGNMPSFNLVESINTTSLVMVKTTHYLYQWLRRYMVHLQATVISYFWQITLLAVDIFTKSTFGTLKIQPFKMQSDPVIPWWHHQMETFSTLVAFCAGNSPVTDEFTSQKPVTWSFDVFFNLHLNKPLGKQSWGWWFETQSRSLRRHYNAAVWHYTIKNAVMQWLN